MTDQRFSIIPGWIVTDPRLKGRDLQVMCLLGRHIDKAGWCFRSQVKMARQLACARSTVQGSLDRLMKIGVVERRRTESFDGRDVSYHYRVIFDRAVADETFAQWEAEEEAEEAPETGCRYTGTPADIPAPPADPESAPPADPGSAPYKNDPCITSPAEQERETRRRADQSGLDEQTDRDGGEPDEVRKGEPPPAGRKASERAFEKTFRAWPTSLTDSRPDAWKAWCRLSPDERERAAEEAGRYVQAALATGRKYVCAHAVYLREKRWEKLPPPVEDKTLATLPAPAFGPLWQAQCLTVLLAGAAGDFVLTRFEQRMVDAGQTDIDTLMAEKRRRTGYPRVNAMYDRAAHGQGITVPTTLEPLAKRMEAVPVGSQRFEEWRAEYARRDWPWVPDPGKHPVVHFPKGGPAGLETFAEPAMATKAGDGPTGGAGVASGSGGHGSGEGQRGHEDDQIGEKADAGGESQAVE